MRSVKIVENRLIVRLSEFEYVNMNCVKNLYKKIQHIHRAKCCKSILIQFHYRIKVSKDLLKLISKLIKMSEMECYIEMFLDEKDEVIGLKLFSMPITVFKTKLNSNAYVSLNEIIGPFNL